ncbi:hypothetical protein D3C80_1745430 [compost metagenome]
MSGNIISVLPAPVTAHSKKERAPSFSTPFVQELDAERSSTNRSAFAAAAVCAGLRLQPSKRFSTGA